MAIKRPMATATMGSPKRAKIVLTGPVIPAAVAMVLSRIRIIGIKIGANAMKVDGRPASEMSSLPAASSLV